MAGGSGIHIKPSHRGYYTARAKRNGRSVQEQAKVDLAPGSKASAAVRKQANFARNAKTKFRHGGRRTKRAAKR